MTAIKPHVTHFYKMLDQVGINMANQHLSVPQRVSDAINAIEDIPEAWWPHMVGFVEEHGVKDPLKVVTGMEQWIALGGPPEVRKAQQQGGTDYSDEFIVRYVTRVLNRTPHDYGDPECSQFLGYGEPGADAYEPPRTIDPKLCPRNHRSDLQRIIGGQAAETGAVQ